MLDGDATAADKESVLLDRDRFPALLTAAQRGEAAAVEELFIDLQPRLLRFLRSMEPRAADDIAAEVWLAIARGIGAFEGELSAWRGWAFSIARRRLADHRRTAARRRTDPVADPPDASGDGGDPVAVVLDLASGQEAVDLVVRSLPPDQADVVLLRVLAGLDAAEVAAIMGRTTNWVRVTQHRACRRLAEVLAPAAGPLADEVASSRAGAVMAGTPQTIYSP